MGNSPRRWLETGRASLSRQGFSRNVTSTFATNILLLPLTLAASAFIARWLGPEGKGQITLALLTPNLLGLILGAGLAVANGYFAGSKRIPVADLARNSVGVALAAALVGGLLTWIGLSTGLAVRLLPDLPPEMILLSLALLPISLLIGYFTAILQGLQRIQRINLLSLAQGVAAFGLVTLLVPVLDLGLAGGIVAYIGAGLVGLLLAARSVGQEGGRFQPRLDRAVLAQTLPFGLRGQVGNLLQFFNYRLDTFIVSFYLGASGVGIYSVAVALAELLWHLPNAASFVIFPKASSTSGQELNSFTPRVFRLVLGVTALGAVAIALAGRPLIVLIFSDAFAASYPPLLALLPGVVLLGGGKVLTSEIAGRGYPEYNSINAGLGLALTVILDLVLIPRYGVMGAAVASSVAYSAIFLLAVYFYLRISRRVPPSDIRIVLP